MAKTAAERKADQRMRDAEHKANMGAAPFNMEMYKGTREQLNWLMEAGQFEEPAEVVTRLIHVAAHSIKRDMSRFDDFLNVTQLAENT
ncbi:hypothetical protein [Amphritea sp. HPY]|uniref:hypothetical protein n=1 Tax=Amphritea sp. HPY TaxID=3421652 RepID=UPI003D7D1668